MKKNLIIMTNKFPYEGGEQFIETEIEFWKTNSFDNVYVMPHSMSDNLRVMPSNIRLIKPNDSNYNFVYGLHALTNPIFYREIFYIFKEFGFKNFFSNLLEALKTTSLSLKAKRNLSIFLKKLPKNNNTIYSYWNDSSFYGACILKRNHIVNRVVSRAHRFDIYEDERANNYMPLKRQFINDFDKVYLLSSSALSYYHSNYDADLKYLDVSSLGVELPTIRPNIIYKSKHIRILSLSYCHPGKQIDQIMNAVYEFANLNLDYKVEWTHIGDGDLYIELKRKSAELMKYQNNLLISFLGELSNSTVKNHLSSNYYDVFINASKSEGIPVSIMEAMSYGIPAIAPDVGSISELVKNSNGHLMPSKFSSKDIIEGIEKIHNANNFKMYRNNAIDWISQRFNASLNYPQFIKKVEQIADSNDSE